VIAANLLDLSLGQVVLRLAVATVLGAVIGFEREFHGHEAGSRTHGLLALGAALFGVISVGAFAGFLTVRADSNVQTDPSRIASYVVAGIGFLAGGTIIKEGHRIRGLTTAASLWVTAAVGLGTGLGYFSAALVASGAALLMLLLDRPLKLVRHRNATCSVRVRVRNDGDLSAVLTAVHAFGLGDDGVAVRDDEGTPTTVVVQHVALPAAQDLVVAMIARADVVEAFLYRD